MPPRNLRKGSRSRQGAGGVGNVVARADKGCSGVAALIGKGLKAVGAHTGEGVGAVGQLRALAARGGDLLVPGCDCTIWEPGQITLTLQAVHRLHHLHSYAWYTAPGCADSMSKARTWRLT
jgi:hypothetical protein